MHVSMNNYNFACYEQEPQAEKSVKSDKGLQM